jgi:predicted flap endonuclease-1-like 5' DNA nuclease
MWMVLAGATVFALFLGWSVRGILLTGKMRKAVVDKDVALTELDQARDEIERLFAAQRAQRGEGGNVADASARKISDLTSELQKAKTELATLKTEATKAGASAAVAPQTEGDAPTIVLPPNRGGAEDTADPSEQVQSTEAAGDEAEAPSLVWRNRHLEARVQHLETQLAEREAAPAAPVAVAPAAVSEAIAEPSADEAGLAKLKWQADYLKQRVEALEAELAKAPAEAPVLADEDLNEEMARLRWRNRFLEGRLAYFEGGAEEAAAEVADPAADFDEAVEASADDVLEAETLVEAETAPDEEETDDPAALQAMFSLPAEDDIVGDEAGDEVGEVSEEDIAELEEDSFEDVSDDEEESLAEADHAGEDVLPDQEYDEEDLVEDNASDDGLKAEDDSADVEEDGSDEQEEAYDEGSFEEDEDHVEVEFEDDADDESEDDEPEEGDFEDDEDGAFEDDEAYDDAGEDDDDSEDEYEAAAEDDDASDEDDEASDEAWDKADEVEDDDDDEGEFDEDDDEASDDEDVSYETEEHVLTERPMAMNGPVEGHPDDLTLIGGIGPKIQILLNELGVWHYDQIAEWTPENVAWMDEHLNFGGRIAREGWVEQAAVLVRDAENV